MKIIQVSAPTTDAKEKVVDEFHDQIEIDRTCKQDLQLVTEKWNAKVEM